mmetsp:Transcript_29478/g.76044  ORF Transcript_29478/g.76044 Transcript_29478/m.76044 type:complete len:86 (-) Transcript_29478:152-409(-)
MSPFIQASFFGNFFPSDDRLKFDEVSVPNGIEVIKQLEPRRYTQVVSLDDDPGLALSQTMSRVSRVLHVSSEKPPTLTIQRTTKR